MRIRHYSGIALALLLAALLGCAPQSRLGMVVDRQTGLQYGSIVERTFVVDPSQFGDQRLKLRIRNVSGDPAFDLSGFRRRLEQAYERNGYRIADGADFGLLVDVNVRYSAQATRNFRSEFAGLGAVAGGLGSYGATRGGIETAAGTVAGATIGYILGTYQREETFFVVADMTVAVVDKNRGVESSSIVFGKSGAKRSRRVAEFKGFRQRVSSRIAVFAGGTNIDQGDISQQVRQRFARIVQDMI